MLAIRVLLSTPIGVRWLGPVQPRATTQLSPESNHTPATAPGMSCRRIRASTAAVNSSFASSASPLAVGPRASAWDGLLAGPIRSMAIIVGARSASLSPLLVRTIVLLLPPAATRASGGRGPFYRHDPVLLCQRIKRFPADLARARCFDQAGEGREEALQPALHDVPGLVGVVDWCVLQGLPAGAVISRSE